ncbi:MAG TPA: nucleotide disphospho-sugar-binding domain-containing protein [Frankiaceae bacterium]|nr:nucleotide disphospho-sugar-binding domain-containing protein [Frankiaceae bacterium]
MTPRVAVVAGPDPGHAFPAVALSCALRDRGVPVLFVSGTQWREAVEREGVAFAAIDLFAPDPRDDDFGFVLWERSKQLAPGIARSLREFGATLAVVDSITVPGWFAADLAGVPRVELVPTSLQEPSSFLPPPGTGLERGRWPLGTLRDAWMRRLHMRSREVGRAECRAARVAIGLPPEGPPVLTVVATLPGLEPLRPDWPPRTEIVGPMEWDPATADLAEPPGDGPLVFLADSSATGRPQTLLALAVEGLRGLRVACTKLGTPVEGMPEGFVAGPGRQAPLLDRAAAVVCAGGHGMVAKALVRGLPLVIVPGPGDQRENALRVERLGAGVHLPAARLTPATLRAAVERVLRDPAYARAARRIGRSAAGRGPAFAAERVLGAAAPSAATTREGAPS